MRYFLDVAYKGTNYHGWQIQKNAHSVQEEIERALSKILSRPIEIVGSGRTDTGVHAEQQLVHFDVEEELDKNKLVYKLNAVLPHDIMVKSARKVTPEAHARFSAVSRAYEYRISPVKNPFLQQLCYVFTKPLNLVAMNEAAAFLLEWEDFQCFSKVKTEVNHFGCNITTAQWVEKNGLLIFQVKANRFLRNMVRAIVGTLLEVGQGRMSLAEFKEVLQSRDRGQAGRSAPADGLFLTKVEYPEDIYVC